MKKIITLIILFIGVSVSACSCLKSKFGKKDYANASYIVQGKILKIVTDTVAYQKVITLEVYKTYKGDQKETLEIRTGMGGGDCGLMVKQGDKWLLFVNTFNGKNNVSICDKNVRYTRGEEQTDAALENECDRMLSYIKKIKKYKEE